MPAVLRDQINSVVSFPAQYDGQMSASTTTHNIELFGDASSNFLARCAATELGGDYVNLPQWINAVDADTCYMPGYYGQTYEAEFEAVSTLTIIRSGSHGERAALHEHVR